MRNSREKNGLPCLNGFLAFLAYAVSLLQPWAGLILCILYYPQEDPDRKKLGRRFLVLAIVGAVAWLIVKLAMHGCSMGEAYIQPY